MNDTDSPSLAGVDRSRRQLLSLAVGVCALFGASPALARGVASTAVRDIAFENLHTGERLNVVYWAEGAYLPEAARQIAWVLRDHRDNSAHAMDPRLVDLLFALTAVLPAQTPYQVISGYRSPATNAMLAAQSDGVASNSLHTQGMAIDIRVPSVGLSMLRDRAKQLQRGGVGFYPRSDFVHVDVGRVRYW